MQQPDMYLISQGLIRYPIRYAIDNNCLSEKQGRLRDWFESAELCYLSHAASGTTTRQTRADVLRVFLKNSFGKYCNWADMQVEALLSVKNDKTMLRRFDAFYVAMLKEPYPDCNPCRDTLSSILTNIDKQRAKYQAAMKIQMEMQGIQPLPPMGVML